MRLNLRWSNPLIEKNQKFFFEKKDFPHCTKYLGHYSSLLAMAAYLTNDILLWEFDSHNTYPDYIVQYSKGLTSDSSELKSFINSKNTPYTKNNYIEKYFYYGQESVYKKISNELLGQ